MRKAQTFLCIAVLLSIILQLPFNCAASAKSMRYGIIFVAKFENLLANEILLDEISKTHVPHVTQLAEQEAMLTWLRSLDRNRTHSTANAKYLAELVLRNQVELGNQKLQQEKNQGKSDAELQQTANNLKSIINAEQALLTRLVQEIFGSGKLGKALTNVASKNNVDVVLDRRGLFVTPQGKMMFAGDLNLAMCQELGVDSTKIVPEAASNPSSQSLKLGYFDRYKVETDEQKLRPLIVPMALKKGINLLVDTQAILFGIENFAGTNLTNDILAVAPPSQPVALSIAEVKPDALYVAVDALGAASSPISNSPSRTSNNEAPSADRKATVAQASKTFLQDQVKEYTASLNNNPNDKNALLSRAYCNLALGDSAAAVKDGGQILQLLPSASTRDDEYIQQLAVIALWLAYQKSNDSAAQTELLKQAESRCNHEVWPYPMIEFYAGKRMWMSVAPYDAQGKREAAFFNGMSQMCKSNFDGAASSFKECINVTDINSGAGPGHVDCVMLSKRMLEILGY